MTVETADVIIIGGGVAGLSTAMQLAKHDTRVIVVERERIGNGSTGRAAGLLGQLRGTAEATRMLMDGVEVVKDLEQRADVEIFVQTGSLRVAETAERCQEIVDLVAMGKAIGFDIDHIDLQEVAGKLPYMRTDDLLDGLLLSHGRASAAGRVGQRLHQSRPESRSSVQTELPGRRCADRRRQSERSQDDGGSDSCPR